MTPIQQLEPKALWGFFEKINSVPRPSKKEERIRQVITDFGNTHGLNTQVDETGNVLIKKPASKGMENRKTIILQAHLDMVCQKNNHVDFDFDKQPIQMIVEGDFVKAKGTTLGADNGIGAAAILAVLAADDLAHPPIEALFTVDEETGMTGALGLKPDFLNGEILLNLDTEEDDTLTIGCAGGLDLTATKSYTPGALPAGSAFELSITGLQGGHSGMQIHEGLGNANKLLARFLTKGLPHSIQIHEIDSGGLRNAIPREGIVRFFVPTLEKETMEENFRKLRDEIIHEYRTLEPGLRIQWQEIDRPTTALSMEDTTILTRALQAVFNGVFRMSPSIPGLVESSNNVAQVLAGDGEIQIRCLIRSSVASGKRELADTIASALQLAGFGIEQSGAYPGWEANPTSAILSTARSVYEDLFDFEPIVAAVHAGLECGIIKETYPGVDMISFGPNIFGAHSPDERVEISSVQKFWRFFTTLLEQIPATQTVKRS